MHYRPVKIKGYYVLEDNDIYEKIKIKLKKYLIKLPNFYKEETNGEIMKEIQIIIQMNITNKVQQFIKERCEKIVTSKIKFKILYNYYVNFEKDNGSKPYSKKKFSMFLEGMGCIKLKKMDGVYYMGIMPKWKWQWKSGEIIDINDKYNEYKKIEGQDKVIPKDEWLKVLENKGVELHESKVLLFPVKSNEKIK